MSVEFTAASDNEVFDNTTNAGLGPAITVGVRGRIDATQTDAISRAVTINSAGFSQAISIYETSTGSQWYMQARNGGINRSQSMFSPTEYIAQTGFDSVAVVLYGGTTFSTYINGSIGRSVETFANSLDMTGATSLDIVTIGGRKGSAQDWDGFLADVAVWNAALTDDEAVAYTSGLSPQAIRPQSLRVHWEGLSGTVNEKMQSITLTYDNAPTLNNSDNPQIIFAE